MMCQVQLHKGLRHSIHSHGWECSQNKGVSIEHDEDCNFQFCGNADVVILHIGLSWLALQQTQWWHAHNTDCTCRYMIRV